MSYLSSSLEAPIQPTNVKLVSGAWRRQAAVLAAQMREEMAEEACSRWVAAACGPAFSAAFSPSMVVALSGYSNCYKTCCV